MEAEGEEEAEMPPANGTSWRRSRDDAGEAEGEPSSHSGQCRLIKGSLPFDPICLREAQGAMILSESSCASYFVKISLPSGARC